MEKVDIAQQRGKRRQSTAAWKEKIWRSSVEKVDMAQHGGKSRYGTAVWKERIWRSGVEKVDMAQHGGKSTPKESSNAYTFVLAFS